MAATAPSERLTSLSQPEEVAQRNLWKEALHRLFLNRLATLGLIVVVLFILAGLVGPYITPYDFLEQEIDNALARPTAQHWLGTDALGRDILSRLLHGARTAAFVGFFTTAISLGIGIVLGGIAGYVRGLADEFLMWLTDVTMSVPGLLLAMLMNTALKRPIAAWFDDMYMQTKNPFYLDTLWLDFVLVFGALAFISWPGFARLLRGQVLSVRETLYVEAARAIGVDERRILTHYIIPNAIGARSHHRDRDRRRGRGHHAGIRLELPGHRRAAAQRQLGFHAERQLQPLDFLSPPDDHSGGHDWGYRICVHLPRRRAQRCPQPAAGHQEVTWAVPVSARPKIKE